MFRPWLDPFVELARNIRQARDEQHIRSTKGAEIKSETYILERREKLHDEWRKKHFTDADYVEALKALLGTRRQEEWMRKQKELETVVSQKRDMLLRLGDTMRLEQQRLQDARAELVFLKENPPSVFDAEEELLKLKTFTYINEVTVTDTFLEVITKPIIISCHETLYDLGNYRIQIFFGDYKRFPLPTVSCVVSTRKDRLLKHPDGASSEGKICFGGYRESQLKELMKRQQYLEVLDIALLSLFCVSDTKIPEVLSQYRRLPPGSPTPSWIIAVDPESNTIWRRDV